MRQIALLLVALGLLAGEVSCGPPSAQEAGTAASTSPKEKALAAEQKKLNELNGKINQQMSQHRQLVDKLNELRGEIAAQQGTLSALQSSGQAALQAQSDAQAAQDLAAQREQIERQVVASQLQEQIQQQKASLARLSETIAQERNWGFDSPELDSNTARYRQEQSNLDELQSQYWDLQQQAGQVAVLQSQSKSWWERNQQPSLQQSFEKQEQDAGKKYDSLVSQYDRLQQQSEKLRNSIGELQSELRASQDNFNSLQAKG